MSDGALRNVRCVFEKALKKYTHSATGLAFVSEVEAKSWHKRTVHLERNMTKIVETLTIKQMGFLLTG